MIPVKVLNGQSMINSIFSSLIILFIRFYQLFVSPLIGINCRFYPTCSSYSIEAFKKYGFLKGIFLSSKRVLSCHPLGSYGFKPLDNENIPFIKKISYKEIQYERKSELYKGLPESYSKYNEDRVGSTIHLGLYLNKTLISGLTLIKKKLNESDALSFQIRGMFTKKKFLKRGYGSMLIKYAKDEVIESKKVIFWCNSRKKAVDFYKKNGFIEKSDFFLIKKIGLHKKLVFKN